MQLMFRVSQFGQDHSYSYVVAAATQAMFYCDHTCAVRSNFALIFGYLLLLAATGGPGKHCCIVVMEALLSLIYMYTIAS